MRIGDNNGGLIGPHRNDESQIAWLLIVIGFCITLALAYVTGELLNTPATAHVLCSLNGVIIGVVGVFPLIVLLHMLMRAQIPALVRFRESQIEFFTQIGFAFTRPRILLMAFAAGASEELLFRGVLQVWSSGFLPAWLAIISTNAIFGALHAKTPTYALIAGVVGGYLGVLFEISGDLITPILTHTVYDAVALEYTRQAVKIRARGL